MEPLSEENELLVSTLAYKARTAPRPFFGVLDEKGCASIVAVDMSRVSLWADKDNVLVFLPKGTEIVDPLAVAAYLMQATLNEKTTGIDPTTKVG